MSGLPKLKIILPYSNAVEEFCDLEQARHRFDWNNETYLIALDGQVINSYKELRQLARQERFRDAEFLVVRILPLIEGG
ncbi:hypothetical protein ACFLYV_04220 [Chloroflexota bacterium]